MAEFWKNLKKYPIIKSKNFKFEQDPVSCTICDKGFTNETALNNHVRISHVEAYLSQEPSTWIKFNPIYKLPNEELLDSYYNPTKLKGFDKDRIAPKKPGPRKISNKSHIIQGGGNEMKIIKSSVLVGNIMKHTPNVIKKTNPSPIKIASTVNSSSSKVISSLKMKKMETFELIEADNDGYSLRNVQTSSPIKVISGKNSSSINTQPKYMVIDMRSVQRFPRTKQKIQNPVICNEASVMGDDMCNRAFVSCCVYSKHCRDEHHQFITSCKICKKSIVPSNDQKAVDKLVETDNNTVKTEIVKHESKVEEINEEYIECQTIEEFLTHNPEHIQDCVEVKSSDGKTVINNSDQLIKHALLYIKNENDVVSFEETVVEGTEVPSNEIVICDYDNPNIEYIMEQTDEGTQGKLEPTFVLEQTDDGRIGPRLILDQEIHSGYILQQNDEDTITGDLERAEENTEEMLVNIAKNLEESQQDYSVDDADQCDLNIKDEGLEDDDDHGGNSDSDRTNDESRVIYYDGVLHMCTECGECFQTEEELYGHIKDDHGDEVVGGATEFHRCKVCDEIFDSKMALMIHRSRHSALGRQRRRRIDGVKSKVCDVCGKECKSHAALCYHQRVHTGEKPFPCDYCPKRFSMRLLQTIHMRTHTGEKPYQCALCPKAFGNKAAILRHERVHTGEKPYSCPECGKCFSQSNSMKLHVRTVHLKLPAPYQDKRKEKRHKLITGYKTEQFQVFSEDDDVQE